MVIGLASTLFGTGKTTCLYHLVDQIRKNGIDRYGLIIDLSFNNQLGRLLNLPEETQGFLKSLLRDLYKIPSIDYPIPRHWKKINLLRYAYKVYRNVHFIPSPSINSYDDALSILLKLPTLIDRLREYYEFIVIDLPYQYLAEINPIIATTNYLLLPYLSGHEERLASVWYFDRKVVELKSEGYSIAVGGVIPTFFAPTDQSDTRELEALRRICGDVIWPSVGNEDSDSFEILYERFKSLIGLSPDSLKVKFPPIHEEKTRQVGYENIYFIDGVGDRSYKELGNPIYSHNIMRRILGELSIFKHRNYQYCYNKISRARRLLSR